mgnify:CR=1 FL=1
MKRIEYSKEKDKWLEVERGISLKFIKRTIEKGNLITVIDNPNTRYRNQRMYLVKIKNYVYVVPFVEDDEKIFLKTIFPSRKHTKKYLKGGKYEKKAI